MLLIGCGKSVDDAREQINELSKQVFTVGVNYAGIDFDCDLIVALDYEFIKQNKDKINKPILTRDWGQDFRDRFCQNIDLIEIRNDIIFKYRFSGDFAIALSEKIKEKFGYEIYLVGFDGGQGHYQGYAGEEIKSVEYPKENKKRGRPIKQKEKEDFAVMNENKQEVLKWIRENLKSLF